MGPGDFSASESNLWASGRGGRWATPSRRCRSGRTRPSPLRGLRPPRLGGWGGGWGGGWVGPLFVEKSILEDGNDHPRIDLPAHGEGHSHIHLGPPVQRLE